MVGLQPWQIREQTGHRSDVTLREVHKACGALEDFKPFVKRSKRGLRA